LFIVVNYKGTKKEAMKMKNERLKILQMLEDGKISADEAARLLEALRNGKDAEKENMSFDEKVSQFSASAKEFAKEFGSKMNSAYKSTKPKINSATQVVIKKTAGVVEGLSKALNEAVANNELKKAGKGAKPVKECCGETEGDGDE